ncbi:MAG: hypothetical protein Q4C23_01770 [Mycoplasmatota bacterium]|nr:hypothetical protein [Mycoplasmatota bacterium]
MKKKIIIFITIMFLILSLIFLVDINDSKYNEKNIKLIKKNTTITSIEYLNYYDNYYLVLDKEYLYLINNTYKIISKIDRKILYENKDNYDIIYKDEQIMYFNDISKNNKLIYEYYDIYNYKLIKSITVG